MTADIVLRVAWDGATAFCLVAGGCFALVGAIGLLRLPDCFMRLHAPTKATTLGVGGVLAASLLHFAGIGQLVVHELLVALFLFVTAPVSGLMLARAAIQLRVTSRAAVPERNPARLSPCAEDRRPSDPERGHDARSR